MTQFHWALDANRTDDHEDILAKEIKATSDETVSSKLVSKSSFSSFRLRVSGHCPLSDSQPMANEPIKYFLKSVFVFASLVSPSVSEKSEFGS